MNKKLIIAVLVGGFLVFLWQTLSHTVLNLHASQSKYTANHDTILSTLSSQLTEEGTYMIPGYNPANSNEEMEKAMNESIGQPWAQVTYHKAMNMNMGMNMLRGFLVDLVAVFLLCWILMKIPNISLQTSVLASISVGVIGYLTTEYATSIWYQTNSIPDLIDAVAAWGLCGTWLGWWFNRK